MHVLMYIFRLYTCIIMYLRMSHAIVDTYHIIPDLYHDAPAHVCIGDIIVKTK